MSLSDFFNGVPDYRRSQGQRYPLDSLLWMVFLSICCGYNGYRSFGKFAKANADYLTNTFSLKHGVPSYVTFREVLTNLDKEALKERFIAWCSSQELTDRDWVSGDGKSLRSTLSAYTGTDQDFCSVVSFYVQKTGLCLLVEDYRNKQMGEAEVVRSLLPALKDKGIILTLDALHTQKKQ